MNQDLLGGLMAAGKEAQNLSIKVGIVGLTIGVIVTAEGIDIAGERYAGEHRVASHLMIPWEEIGRDPAQLVSKVRIVNDALLAKSAEEETVQ